MLFEKLKKQRNNYMKNVMIRYNPPVHRVGISYDPPKKNSG